MSLNKVYRRWIASMLATVMVCLQLATAAYACVQPTQPMVMAMAEMPDCANMSEMDKQQPQLCKAHCDRDKQSVNTAPGVVLVAAPVVDWLASRMIAWVPVTPADALPAVFAAHTDPPVGSAPVYLTFLVLRN
ncbi:hypothetical protein [Rhizobacter sp. Root1221]|uniref:hypothetical protein n=1 Tax=Rhizobacter sp. Root1221 TaxID=1736433 RepID=UPI0006FD9AC9|nr:hypothetical protein [Rhizobacter sp. Root1221]